MLPQKKDRSRYYIRDESGSFFINVLILIKYKRWMVFCKLLVYAHLDEDMMHRFGVKQKQCPFL